MITESMLNRLRLCISSRMSERRYNHTLGVEKMALFLAEHCLPERKTEISAAALLHDVTKEMPADVQLKMLKDFEKNIFECGEIYPAVIHSFTAPYVVKSDFPEFATEEILSAVAKHTLGEENMSIFDRIIFLADFIEEGRTYPDSVSTRKFVRDSMKSGKIEENIAVLNRACIMQIDSTVSHLKMTGKQVNKKTLLAKAWLISKV